MNTQPCPWCGGETTEFASLIEFRPTPFGKALFSYPFHYRCERQYNIAVHTIFKAPKPQPL